MEEVQLLITPFNIVTWELMKFCQSSLNLFFFFMKAIYFSKYYCCNKWLQLSGVGEINSCFQNALQHTRTFIMVIIQDYILMTELVKQMLVLAASSISYCKFRWMQISGNCISIFSPFLHYSCIFFCLIIVVWSSNFLNFCGSIFTCLITSHMQC